MTKAKQDNDVSNRITLVYTKIETQLLGPILPCVRSMMETWKNNDVIDPTSAVYTKNDNELSWLIELSIVYEEN